MLSFLGANETLRFDSVRLKNFLSFRDAELSFGEFTALIGLNASGKSNFVTAMKLLREIPTFGLPTSIARRGGFDQMRHRSGGRPFDPSIEIRFQIGTQPISSYSLALKSVRGKRYEVKRESATVYWAGDHHSFTSDGVTVLYDTNGRSDEFRVPVLPGQSALGVGGGLAVFVIFSVLKSIQTVELNTSKMREIQEPSSTQDFEPDGSNAASVYELLSPSERSQLADELATIVPTVARIDVEALTDRQTLTFAQRTPTGTREFSARQMSDGTLRAFGILLAAGQKSQPSMLVVEEPETAIHMGAMKTLTELLLGKTETMQIVVTTHSAEIVDFLPTESLRVVRSKSGESTISPVAEHTKGLIAAELARPGELLRLNALDGR